MANLGDVESQRIKGQIERLLNQADGAATRRRWSIVSDRAQEVLALAPSNSEAQRFLDAATRALQSPTRNTALGFLAGLNFRPQILIAISVLTGIAVVGLFTDHVEASTGAVGGIIALGMKLLEGE